MKHPLQESTVDYFQSVHPSLEGLGDYFENTTPIMLAAKKFREKRQQQQMAPNGVNGDVDFNSAGVYIVGIGIVVLAGALSYQAGKAMAPKKSSENSWGWVAVPLGLFMPLGMGLGIMGAVANSGK